jgi:hypothetical protein
VNVLFYMGERGLPARHFESALRVLAERGHRLQVVFSEKKEISGDNLIEELARQHANVSFGPAPPVRPGSLGTRLRKKLRSALDYLLYLEPPLAGSPKARRRMEERAPRSVRLLTARGPLSRGTGLRLVKGVLRALERTLRPPREIERFVAESGAELVLATPLVLGPAMQVDLLRAAKRLGIPTGICVISWDNLTTKGAIHEMPDFVTVWNEGQKREAIEIHAVPPERVIVTGAVSFDHWFDWGPSTSREEFCRRVGLDPDRPYLLYVCSSPFTAGRKEAGFVERWIDALADRGLALESGVLVRPYPSVTAARQWEKADLSKLGGNVAVWPRAGDAPVDEDSRAGYFDSIYHSAGVVGVNTSALIESAIVGRPVYSILAPEFRDTQTAVPHFSLVTDFAGGILNVADSFDEHADQLRQALNGSEQVQDEERRRRFLEAFVRPHGLSSAAGPVLVRAMERACEERRS